LRKVSDGFHVRFPEREVVIVYTAGRSYFQYNVSISTCTPVESESLRVWKSLSSFRCLDWTLFKD